MCVQSEDTAKKRLRCERSVVILSKSNDFQCILSYEESIIYGVLSTNDMLRCSNFTFNVSLDSLVVSGYGSNHIHFKLGVIS